MVFSSSSSWTLLPKTSLYHAQLGAGGKGKGYSLPFILGSDPKFLFPVLLLNWTNIPKVEMLFRLVDFLENTAFEQVLYCNKNIC